MNRLSITDRVKIKIASRVTIRRETPRRTRGIFTVCFDDIPRSAWTEGGPVLAQHGVQGTYYLNGGLAGRMFEGREQHTREDVAAIAAARHEIGSHLYDHISVLRLNGKALERQIAMNDRFFCEVLGPDFRAENFAYPYGDMSVQAKRICARRFRSCRSVMRGLNNGTLDQDQLKIIPLDQGFAYQVAWDEVIERAAAEKSWLIALAHGVEERPPVYSCHPHTLDRVLQLARHAGLEIMPVHAALQQNNNMPLLQEAA